MGAQAAERRPATLMVIIPDRLSDLVAKGEVTSGYYNPGNLFDDVHLVMTADDQLDPAIVRSMAGDARLSVYCLPMRRGWRLAALAGQPWLLRGWASTAVRLAERVKPALVRCHGNWWNGYLAVRIKGRLGIPFIVSLHTNPDADVRPRASGWKAKLWTSALQNVERMVLRRADAVLPVYEAIVPYLSRMGLRRWTVIYNAVNARGGRKDDYRLHQPVRVLSVGRQVPGKNPEPIIQAMAQVPGARLTVVGDGELHERLVQAAAAAGVGDRVQFQRSVPNDALCRLLPESDIVVLQSDYWELSKSLLEALLAGLPAVINRRPGSPVPELSDAFVRFTDGTPDGYASAIRALITDDAGRERLGRAAAAHARAHWAPEAMEARTVAVYRQLLERGRV
jgi:glycosyltransferase involved in cell wall biosynthesis